MKRAVIAYTSRPSCQSSCCYQTHCHPRVLFSVCICTIVFDEQRVWICTKVVMESTTNQTFDSDDSEKYFQVENYNGHEFVDDELSRTVGLCLSEDDKILEHFGEAVPLAADGMEPYIGMEFNSRDDAREYYIAYGRSIGFTVRIHHNRRSRINNMVIGQDFVCSKEGFREKKYIYRKDRVLPPPPITREGCPAMLRLALRDGAKWVVNKFIKDHNHELLSPSRVPWRGSAKKLVNEDEKDRRIRELIIELNNERQRCKRRCAAYQEQLRTLLSYIEEHNNHMSNKVQDIVKIVREFESKQMVETDCKCV